MGYLLDCLDWVPNRGACIDAYLSGDVTRSFRLHDIKLFGINSIYIYQLQCSFAKLVHTIDIIQYKYINTISGR